MYVFAQGEMMRVDERIRFGIYQSCGNRGVLDVCLCLDFGGEWVVGLAQGPSRLLQAIVQIVSKAQAPSNGARFTVF